ncbi:MAG TPA: NGG1p interacting factor NIF3 [Thermoleophilia bacterium]|nr:NGG1p interacting factor NIF3 [Thermoleophilia bacterium]
MRLGDLYNVAVEAGKDADPRGSKGIERALSEAKKAFDELPEPRRWEFDRESLTNPFSDTRILGGDPDTDVRRMLVGIDISVGEVLLADRLREKGEALDLVLAHHPEGRALADLSHVMGVQADIWRTFGVPIGFGDGMMAGRRAEVDRRFHASNIDQAVSAARILGIPLMCCHTPADNNVNSFLQAKCDEFDEDATVGDIVDMLKTIPEYREAVQSGVGPVIFQGAADFRAGKIMVDMTGGTSGPEEAIDRLASAGVGTILGMHMGEDHRKRAEAAHLNVVIAGHHASDSLGMNLVIDRMAAAGVEVVGCSGFTRVSRV